MRRFARNHDVTEHIAHEEGRNDGIEKRKETKNDTVEEDHEDRSFSAPFGI